MPSVSVPGYELVKRLGVGGMGEVWKAKPSGPIGDGLAVEHVAIKFIKPEYLARATEKSLLRFEREKAVGLRVTAGKLNAYLLPVYDAGEVATLDDHGEPRSVPYLVMKYCTGGAISALFGELRADLAKALNVFVCLAQAVKSIHESGILHRDIKPDNILFDKLTDGRTHPYLSDYGIAKVADAPPMTSLSDQFGNGYHVSPEHIRGGMFVTEKSDLFSLGTVFYEVLTGSRPFESDDRGALQKQIQECKVTPPSELNPELSAAWNTVCMGLLRADQDTRYGTADELLEDLNRLATYTRPIGPLAIPSVRKFRKGRIELNVLVHVGGDGKVVYTAPVGITTTFDPKTEYIPPPDVVAATEQMIQSKIQSKPGIYNGKQVKIDNFEFGITPDSRQLQYPLHLVTSVTTYFATQRTNDSMRIVLPNRKTIREECGGDPNDYSTSKLSNPLAINLSVITADGQIFIARRGKKTGNNPGIWAAAVSGTTDPDEDCKDGVYNPFKSAINEAKQEIFGDYAVKEGDIKLFGLARTLTLFFPFLFGEVCHKEDSSHLRSLQPPGQFEIAQLHSRPFTIPDVCAWVRELYHERGTDGYRTVSAHAAIFSLLQSLIYRYKEPEEQQAIIRLLSQ